MLRRLDVKNPWRSLTPGFWPADAPLGKGTVIYGHNGSGKSTLAELLLDLSGQSAAAEVLWEPKDGRTQTVHSGTPCPSPAMAVFTRKWVQANLDQFLAGENADAIVTLGEAAIGAKEEEERLAGEIERLRSEADRVEGARGKAEKKVTELARAVQDRLITELQRFDYNHYTKSRFSVSKVSDLLRTPRTDFPDLATHTDALLWLGEDAPTAVPTLAPAPSLAEELEPLEELLGRTPTSVTLAELEADAAAQAWVERGQVLHREREQCLFCEGSIDEERRQQLARHFDESWLQIRSESQRLLDSVTRHRNALTAWPASLPAPEALASDLRAAYQHAVEVAKAEVQAQVERLERVETALREKISDPNSTPPPPDIGVVPNSVPTTVLVEAVTQHNEQVHRHDELKTERLKLVFDHIVGSDSRKFRDLEEEAGAAKNKLDVATHAASLAEKALDRLQQESFTTKEMADQLTADLARVYGKHHLTIAVTGDGRSYSCRRGDEPATNLSEGERTTLSLLYFLRNLEDQKTRGVEPKDRIVVIDDPSSSLDRESLFATHQWLISTLKEFGQYIVLTHDFNLLRLFITSHRNKWNDSAKQIGKQDAAELHFPRVSFLELFAATVDGERSSKMGPLPNLLRNSTTEYGYLFLMVMKGIKDADDHDHERLFLLPNAARRVLEVFASYKAPHRPNFLQQLEYLVTEQPSEPHRDVYDFCNRFSHGEGPETVEVLDARAVQGDIRRCMQFLRSVDSDHFNKMCEAVKVDPAVLD